MTSWRLAAVGAVAAITLCVAIATPREAAATMAPQPALTPRGAEPITPVAPPPALDPRKVALGRDLFADPRLSASGTLTCGSCHDLGHNGAGPSLAGRLNTPTIFNATRNFRLGWEGRFRSPEAQFKSILESPEGMNLPVSIALARLQRDPVLQRRFQRAYGRRLDEAALLDAVATYEATLVTPDSRFDQWLEGRADALSAQELRGYQLFKHLGCVSCHQGQNVGGNLYARHGVFHPLASPDPQVLRVPSLRNVAETAPYFHDGSAPTLEDAVTKMARAQLDWNPTAQEIQDIAAFLRTLTGRYDGRPLKAAP